MEISPLRGSKKKTLQWYSVWGPITVTERVWALEGSGYRRPLSERIGVRHRCCSRSLRRVLVDFGSDQSFAKAVDKVGEHYGFEINASAVRKATLECAREVAEQVRQETGGEYRTLPEGKGPTIIAEADGSFVATVQAAPRKGPRPREYQEIRLAAAQAQGNAQAVYAASFESVEDLGKRWGHIAKSAGRTIDSAIHGLGDGAEWIARQVEEVFGLQGSFLCDLHHVKDYLLEAAPTCEPGQPARWVRTQKERLKRGAKEKVLAELKAHRETDSPAGEEAPVRAAYRYLDRRRDQLDYAGALARDLPIGSGLIESGHKHVLQARLKLPGCAWLKETASDMAQLRVFRTNGRWAQLWN